MPFLTKYALTVSARACESARLSANFFDFSGTSSVWPWISSLMSLNSTSTATALSSVAVEVGGEVGFAGLEVDALDRTGERLQLLGNLVGAAVFVLEAVLGLGLVRALVEAVDDAVAVGVLVGAALVLGRAGLVRALVLRVGDAVLVVVEIGAAVRVLEAVFVLGFVRALVLRVGDAVAVGVLVLGLRLLDDDVFLGRLARRTRESARAGPRSPR